MTCVLTRVLSLAGQVAFRQAVFMEVDVLTEMKRRQAVTEDRKTGGQKRNKSGSTNSSKVPSLLLFLYLLAFLYIMFSTFISPLFMQYETTGEQ